MLLKSSFLSIFSPALWVFGSNKTHISCRFSVDSNNYSRHCERIYFPAGQTPRIMLDCHTTTSEVSCTATAAISTGSHAEIMHWDVMPNSQDFSIRLFSTIKQVSSSIMKIIMLHHEDYYAPSRRLLHDHRFSIWNAQCSYVLVMIYLPEIRKESCRTP